MLKVDLVLFDMAGTTVVDSGQVPAAFAQALAQAGVTVTPEQLQAVRGAAKREAIGLLLAQATPETDADRTRRVEETYTIFRALLHQHFQTGVAFVPGALQSFSFLRSQGIQVALNTGFDRPTVDLLLAALPWPDGQMDGLVGAVICGDDVAKGRPAPYMIFRAMERTGVIDVGRVMVVGDTALDLQAAANAGVAYRVGVLSGAHGRAQLTAAPHTHILASVAELPSLFV